MAVNVKLNNLVWMLTGRSSGFAYPLLNTFISVPPVPEARVRRAREMLKLDVVGNDFFVYGALASIYSSLYYMRTLDVEHQASFVPGVIPFQYRSADVYARVDGEVVYSAGVPVALSNSNAWTLLPYYNANDLSILSNPINWDEPHDALRLQLAGTTVTVTKYWRGVQGDSTSVTVVSGGDVIQVDAFEFAGLRAAFDKSSGNETWINTPPTIYPYGLVRARIAQNIEMIDLMLEMGTVGAFHEASNDALAVGALAVAIVRRMTLDGAALGPSYEVLLDYPTQAYLDSDLVPYLDPYSVLYISPIIPPSFVPDTMQLIVNFDNPPVPCHV
jgi:hypothetical protein